MEKRSWLVVVWLVTSILLFSSCTQNVTEATTTTPPTLEATKTATQTSPTPETKIEIETEATTTAPSAPEPTIATIQTPPPTLELEPASFSINGLAITPNEVTAGSSVVIEALVSNSGELTDTYNVALKIDDTIEYKKLITLEGHASQNVTFSVTKWMAGTYSVSIEGQSDTLVVKSIPLPSMDDFMKGIWFNDWGWSFDKPRPPMYGPLFYPPQADPSLKSLATTGANWISVVVGIFQETVSSTDITSNQYRTASDDSLRHIIKLAHSLGIRVVLVPFVTLSDDPDHSWVQIGSSFTSEKQWQEWFASYGEHINHYASLAQEVEADIFYVGSELPGTTHREADWRRVIKEVRERFKGPISYDSVFWGNPTAEYKRIKFWDALDYIATDFWFSLTNKNDPTIEELKQGWINTGFLISLENVSKQYNKPVIISEIGYDNFDGVNTDPSGIRIKGAPEDLQEQADCYQAALETIWGKPWLQGIFWWQWNAISVPTPWPGDPHGKLAEDVLRKFYLSQ